MKEFQPLVSVIINCFNGETYLREAIDSVIAQTYTNWEIIFWDNQSTDSTSDIVKSYDDSRIHYYYSPTHTALGEARNLAVEKANGDYINFLDADDVWALNKLEEQIKLIIPGKCEVVYTHFSIKYESVQGSNYGMYKYYKKLSHYCPNNKRTIYQNLLFHNWIIFSSIIFNKKLFMEVGGINPHLKQNEDYEILLKCSLKTDIRCSDNSLVYYRIHNSNNSSLNGMSYIVENRMIFNELPKSKDLAEAKRMNEIRCSIYYWRNNNKCLAIKHLLTKGSVICLLQLCYRHFIN